MGLPLTMVDEDTVVTIIDESESSGDVVWWPVLVNEAGERGWVDASVLELLTSGPDPESTP